MEKEIEDKVNTAISNIVRLRKGKGYSLEYMANLLDLSIAAYDKLEKQKTRLTLQRLFQLQEVLNEPLHKILDVEVYNNFYQTNENHSSGFLINEQNVHNLYQDNQETKDKLIQSLESQIKELQKSKKV